MTTQSPSATDHVPDALKAEALHVAPVDPLLECLVFLSAHYGRAKSAQALLSGTGYDAGGMGPAMFCEVAAGLQFKTKIAPCPDFMDVPSAVFPVVLILKNNQACVLLDVQDQKARIFLPQTKSVGVVDVQKLAKDFAFYAIYVHPEASSEASRETDADDQRQHWFWGIVHENKDIYGMVLLGGVFINLFALASPFFIMNVYDRVIPNNAIETGWVLGIGALTVFIFDLIMKSLRAYLIDVGGRRIDVIAAKRIYDQLLNIKLANRPRSSGAFANMLRDFDSVRDFFTSATITGLVDVPFSLFFLFMVYQLGGLLAFILVFLIALVIGMGFFIQARLKGSVRRALKIGELKHGLLVESIHGLETIKAIGADGRLRRKYMEAVGDNAAQAQESRFWSGLAINISSFIQQIASVLLVLAGMYMVQSGDMTVGSLIATVMLGGRAVAPIGQIASLMTRYHQAGGALKTLNKIMAEPVERPKGKEFLHRPDLQGKIAFESVGFSYPGVQRKILDRVSFTINPGERVGIIGRVGSGKSTVAKLIMGLYEPDEGAILADNTDYRQIDPADVRRNIAYIAQDVMLFSGSVRDNITASVPQATEEAILSAAKASGVHDFVSRHPMGYDAAVGEHGHGLSGGQRQAIALARAMLLRPKIMVCDEPTNAMDVQAEEAFMRYVQDDIKNKTFIMVTHRQPMLALVDRLILMEQGRVLMDGPREEVLQALQTGKIGARQS